MKYIQKPTTVIPLPARSPTESPTEKDQLPLRDPDLDADGFNMIRAAKGCVIGYIKARDIDDDTFWEGYSPEKKFIVKAPTPTTAIKVISEQFYRLNPGHLRPRR